MIINNGSLRCVSLNPWLSRSRRWAISRVPPTAAARDQRRSKCPPTTTPSVPPTTSNSGLSATKIAQRSPSPHPATPDGTQQIKIVKFTSNRPKTQRYIREKFQKIIRKTPHFFFCLIVGTSGKVHQRTLWQRAGWIRITHGFARKHLHFARYHIFNFKSLKY